MNNFDRDYLTALYNDIVELTAESDCINLKKLPYSYELIMDEILRLQKETLDLFGDDLEVFVRAMVEFDDYDRVEDKIKYNVCETWGACCDFKRLPAGTEIVTNDYFVLIAKDRQVLYYLAR
jgi:hypothetical protein